MQKDKVFKGRKLRSRHAGRKLKIRQTGRNLKSTVDRQAGRQKAEVQECRL